MLNIIYMNAQLFCSFTGHGTGSHKTTNHNTQNRHTANVAHAAVETFSTFWTFAADFMPRICEPSYGFGLRATARRSIVW